MPCCNNLRSYYPHICGCHGRSEVKRREYSQCLNSFSAVCWSSWNVASRAAYSEEQTVATEQRRGSAHAVLLVSLWKGAPSEAGPQSVTGGGNCFGQRDALRLMYRYLSPLGSTSSFGQGSPLQSQLSSRSRGLI